MIWENLIGEGIGKIMSMVYVKIIFNVNERNSLKKNNFVVITIFIKMIVVSI